MICKICYRQVVEQGFCDLHLRAYENVLNKFSAWNKATDINWNQYLLEIQKNSLTGKWAKEVANYLIKEEKECPKK